jgi:hypothetical protein
MSDKRKYARFTRMLEVEFSAGADKFTGITSNFSKKGIFIRTRYGLPAGALIDIVINLPGNKTSRVKGVVRRSVKAKTSLVKNGMGVELIHRDANFLDFIKASGA